MDWKREAWFGLRVAFWLIDIHIVLDVLRDVFKILLATTREQSPCNLSVLCVVGGCCLVLTGGGNTRILWGT